MHPINTTPYVTHFAACGKPSTMPADPSPGPSGPNLKTLSEAVEQSPAIVVITDLAGTIEYVNPRFTESSGYSREEALGQNPRILKSGDWPAESYQELWETLASGQVWRGEFHNRKKNGERYWEQASISPLRDAQGTPTGYLAIKEDITARKQAEREQAKLQAQLLQSQKMESLGSLAGGIAHDFNNILGAILGAAELLNLQLEKQHAGRSALEIIFQAGRRARELNKQILTFSRKGKEERVAFNLSALIKEALRLLHATLPKSVQVQGQILDSLWISGDSNQIHQVFMNLSINAFHALGPEGGQLTIELSEVAGPGLLPETGGELPAGRFALLAVRDDGCGMDSVVLARIFDPFFTTKDSREGTGLGLAVVHGIVHKHEGAIHVASAVGTGSLFQVLLPLTGERPLDPRVDPAAAPRGGERILLVDDEDFLTALSKQGLQELGYQVTAKTSSLDAWEAFKADPTGFDLLVTDLVMPDLSGSQLAERIQKIRPGLPTLLITGEFQTPDRLLTHFDHYDEILHKPLAVHDLARAIRRVLAAREQVLRQLHGPESGPRPGPAAGEPAHILLVEDNRETRTLIRSMLVREGYAVQEAGDGQEAWELYLSAPDPGHFRMVMTDILMPRMDGLELVSRIRQLDPLVPVVILSAAEQEVDLESARTLRISEFITKPFDPRGLSDCVKFFLGEK
jgi:PAS domain S-box-containing protein